MSVLENDVKDTILRLFAHDEAVIDAETQGRLALWATMKAILFDQLADTAYIPRYFGHHLRIERKPHAGTYVWMAAYHDPSDGLSMNQRLIYAKDDGQVIAVCITFTFIRLTFQVLIPFYPGTLAEMESFGGSVIQLFPSTTDHLAWPPPYRFDGQSIGALEQRIHDNRKSVAVTVRLASTHPRA
ncbi:hypothetical protein ACIA5C_31205 [Actinoplanes sp. NPDC051343]|uniref:hypothetical protein n=1 Tax=Actinoplanes sp. NPDC051343 TaxID=3363906 RepID=UPI00379F0330